jgi:hypothetical protein
VPGAAFPLLHVLLVAAAAFLIGARLFRETQPKAAAEDEDVRQLQRFASIAAIGIVILMLAVLVGLDLGVFRVARIIQ